MDKTYSPLQRYRERHGLTQQQLADKLAVSQGFIARLENGERAITPQKAIAWESVLHIDRAELCPEIFAA